MYFASCNNIDEDLRVKPEDDFLENFEDDILEKFEDNFLNELVEFCVSDCSCAERMQRSCVAMAATGTKGILPLCSARSGRDPG